MNPTSEEFEKLKVRRPELVDEQQLDRELDLEYHNAMLFASKRVLKKLDAFRAEKSAATWKAAMRAMKSDLYS